VPASIIGRALRRTRAGTRHSTWSAPEFAAPETLVLTSPDFVDGRPIPAAHAGGGGSPGLRWDQPPAGTVQLLLVIEDVDVPFPRPLTHTVALIPRGRRRLAPGGLRADDPEVRFLRTVLGRGYHGPAPIPGHGSHHYGFLLHALDEAVPDDVRSLCGVRSWIGGHVLARGRLTGTYEL
jgi:phosphatidylethanolamine-binding protein (PEBP) family uncharacterized protein